MSLGLGDLNKKSRKSAQKSTKAQQASEKSLGPGPAPLKKSAAHASGNTSTLGSPARAKVGSGSKRPFEKPPAGAWAARSVTRPWSDTNLSKSRAQSRKSGASPDAAMSDEWSTQHAPCFFEFDIMRKSFLFKWYEQFTDLERRVQAKATETWDALRDFCFGT
jgi:hypothetical protein